MTYSIKKASKHSFVGVALTVLPSVLTWLTSRHFLTDGDAALITALVTAVISAYGSEFSAFRAKLKQWQEDQK